MGEIAEIGRKLGMAILVTQMQSPEKPDQRLSCMQQGQCLQMVTAAGESD